MTKVASLGAALCLLVALAFADEVFPGADWQDAPDPLASPDARVGGELRTFAGQYPQSLNYYRDNNTFNALLFSHFFGQLLDLDPVTAEYVPGLAEKWSISDDKKTFTFWIDPRAKWSDGKPITAADVQWTFDAVVNPSNVTGVHKVSLEVFERPEIVSNLIVRFTAGEVHWRNLGAVGGFHILPKHVFAVTTETTTLYPPDRGTWRVLLMAACAAAALSAIMLFASRGRGLPVKRILCGLLVGAAVALGWISLMRQAGRDVARTIPRDFNEIDFDFPVVAGPYRLGEMQEGVLLRIHRVEDWWGRACARYRNSYNFETITYRFFAERENAFEAFKKGVLDVYPVYTARLWVKETSGERFDRNWIVKQKIFNRSPVGFQGFAMNMRRAPFDDLRVRQALAYLLNREEMNRTMMYSQYFMHRSYYEDLYSQDDPCTNTVYPFDKEKARRLLADAGWQANPATGILEKDGKPFVLHFLTRDPSSDKFLAMYGEDLKDVGIKIEVDRKDWAAWVKDMQEFNFDMTWAAWGAGLFKDPEGMWASGEAERAAGNNITGFKNDEVDALIEEQKTIFDLKTRHEICRRVDRLVTDAVPYALLWNLNYTRLLYWNKFGMPGTVLSKYSDESALQQYWWYDPDSAADLADAVRTGADLPARPEEVVFDQVFPGQPTLDTADTRE